MYRFIVLLCLGLLVMGEEKCPDIQPLASFEWPKYTQGTWYEIARFYNKWQKGADCVSVTHKIDHDRYKFVERIVVNNKVDVVESEIHTDGPGRLTFVSAALSGNKNNGTVTVYILAVDYEKYSIAYHCGYDSNNVQHVYVWVFSRTKSLDAETIETVKNFFNSTHFLDVNTLSWDHLDDKTCKVN